MTPCDAAIHNQDRSFQGDEDGATVAPRGGRPEGGHIPARIPPDNRQECLLIVSHWQASPFLEAVDHYPEYKQFSEYVKANYREIADFENSQRLFS
jgi:hypothetical protein